VVRRILAHPYRPTQPSVKAHLPQDVDVGAIRNRLGMTQARFSDTFGFSLDAIKHWEGGWRAPEAPTRTLLTVIDKNPAAVLAALNPAAFAAAGASSKPTTVHIEVKESVRPLVALKNGRLILPSL